jgi:hypothetical protein
MTGFELPIWVAAAMLVGCAAGFWLMLKMQDRYIEKLKDRRDDEGGMKNW